MSKYITHTITVQHKDGVRQHHVMASDDASAIHQVPLNPEHERIVGIRRTEHANTESRKLTHSASFKTDDLFGGSGHITTHYISVGPRGSVEKEIKKMTDKNPQLGTPVGSSKLVEDTRITYADLKVILEGEGSKKWMVFHPSHTHGMIVTGKTAARALLKHMHAAGQTDMVMAPCGRGDKPVKSKILHEKADTWHPDSDVVAQDRSTRVAPKVDYQKQASHTLVNAASPHKPPVGSDGKPVSHIRVTHPGGRMSHHTPESTDHSAIMGHIKSGARVEHFNAETGQHSVISAGRVGGK